MGGQSLVIYWLVTLQRRSLIGFILVTLLTSPPVYLAIFIDFYSRVVIG